MASKANTRSAEEKAAVTANRLSDGLVVWLTGTHEWVENFSDAEIFAGAAIDDGIAEGVEAEKRLHVVAAYAVDVELTGEGPVPVKTRERVRVLGPSVRSDLAPAGSNLFPLTPSPEARVE